MTTPPLPSGARLLIDALLAQGVDTVFCVPGESFLDAMDALYDQRDTVRLIVCRHEGSATFMAEAYAKASGKPGVCFVTRAPGASQASIGLHTAFQDGTPLILFIGQVSRHFMERGAFQEVDYRGMFAPVSKWVAQIDQAERMGEMVHRAFHTALTGRMGPVVLALPEDVLSEAVPNAARPALLATAPASAPQAADLAKLMQFIQGAHKPMLVLGGSGWNAQAVAALSRFVHATGLPVACSFRRQDLFDHRDPHYVGLLGLGADPALLRAVQEADLLILLGARMGEVPSQGYSLIDIPQPQQTLVHAMPCALELGRVYRPHLALLSSMPALAQSLAALSVPDALPERFASHLQTLRAGYEAFSGPRATSACQAGTIDMAQAWLALDGCLPDDVIISNGAGNYAAWAHRYYRYRSYGSQIAPTSGAMGYGLPAAIGAKLAHPKRPVLCLAGDGCFLMSSHELATAVKLELSIVIVVFDNQMYGTIRMHQEKWFPGRVHGTALDNNPDFAALARAYGARGLQVGSVAELQAAILQGFSAKGPTLIHVMTDPEYISPNATLSGLRKQNTKPV